MAKHNASSGGSFRQSQVINREHDKKNKAISATFARREYLLRELKETDTILHHLMNQLDLDEEYKKLTKV